MEKFLLIFQLAATLALFGIIWLVQIVHYPLFSFTSEEKYREFHAAHMNLISYVVAPMMIIEAITAILLLFYPPPNSDWRLVLFGTGLIAVVWASTFFIQVPLHEKLAEGFDSNLHRSLINTNWIRTFAWTLRTALVLWFAWLAMK